MVHYNLKKIKLAFDMQYKIVILALLTHLLAMVSALILVIVSRKL